MWSWRKWMIINISSVQFSCSVVSDSLRPHEPKHTVKPPVHHQLLESTQTHVHCVSNAIQPSHPLSSPSASAFSLSQHQGLFQWVSSSNQGAKVLKLQLHQSFQWTFGVDFLYDWLVWHPCYPRDSQESSPAPQFKGINSSALNIIFTHFINILPVSALGTDS